MPLLPSPPGPGLFRVWRALLSLTLAGLLGVPTVRAQAAPDPQIADPIDELLVRIQNVTGPDAEARFRALTAPAAGEALHPFITRWFSGRATQLTLQERDRQTLVGGVRLFLDALVETDGEAELATWRLDVAPVDGQADWRVRQATTLSAVEGLFRLRLDSTRQFRARDLAIRAEDLELRLPDGTVFVAEADGLPTAIVLIGRGEMVFRPAPETERRQLDLFAGSESLEERFDAAFVRLSPGDAARQLPAERITTVDVDPERVEEAERIFAEEVVKSFVVDLPGLSTEAWSLLPPPGDLLAEIRTRQRGTLTYVQSAADAEDIALFDRRARRNIASYASRERLALRGPFFDEDDRAEYDVLAYDVSVRFSPGRLWLEGETRLRIKVLAPGLRTFILRLAQPLVVRSVTSDAHGRLLSFRVRGQNRLVVNLPDVAHRGDELAVVVQYAGRLEPRGVDRENLQVEQEPPSPPRFLPPVLAEPSPAWVYSVRSDWYAQAPISDFAPATIRFDVPPPFGVSCSGAPAAGSPVALETADGEPLRRFVFAAINPIRYLACAVAQFSDAEHLARRVPGGADAAVAGAAGSEPDIALHLMNATRNRGQARDTLTRAGDILTFYASIMGDVPYDDVTVATIESLVPGGHAPAHLAVLYQPLPTSPLVWGGDPANFDAFGDFFLAHELAHQWWGQAVGWQNYHEQWLSEGFAQYFAALYAEHHGGAGAFRDVLRQLARWTRSESDQGPVYLGYRIGHLDGDARAFRAVVYNKGAMVLHMLRLLMGDEAFFDGLRRFYREQRFSKAGTADIQRAMEQASGLALGSFFEAWIFGQDLPRARISWTAESAVVRVTVDQREGVFTFPLPVTLVYADGTRETTSVAVREPHTIVELPLAGRLRRLEFNDDETIPVDID